MQDDPSLQALEDARTSRMIVGELHRVLRRTPTAQPRGGIVRAQVVNGYRDGNGDFQEHWMMGDIVTDDATSKPLAP